MTPKQYERWKDFSIRMARHAFPDKTEVRRQKIEAEVTNFFSFIDGDDDYIARIVDWDCNDENAGERDWRSSISERVLNYLLPHEHYRFDERTGQESECENRFHNQVSCCIRAGLDRAASPSSGVLGFTVGDLRRMYPKGLPSWVVEGYEPPITTETPDDMGVWL